jgi:hypothetical protein
MRTLSVTVEREWRSAMQDYSHASLWLAASTWWIIVFDMNEKTYIRVRWLHDFRDEPIELWSELDQLRLEIRKLEIFRDGTIGYASATETAQGTQLGSIPVPPLKEIAMDPQFVPEEISQDEFEREWNARDSS